MKNRNAVQGLLYLSAITAMISLSARADELAVCQLQGGGQLTLVAAPMTSVKNGSKTVYTEHSVAVQFDDTARSRLAPGLFSVPQTFRGWIDTSDENNSIIGFALEADSAADSTQFIKNLGNYPFPPTGNSDFDAGVKNMIAVDPSFKALSDLDPIKPHLTVYIGTHGTKVDPKTGLRVIGVGGQDRKLPNGVRGGGLAIELDRSFNNGGSSAGISAQSFDLEICTLGKDVQTFSDLKKYLTWY